MNSTNGEVVFGTREWACRNVNCVDGCAHNCQYCYAKEMAIRLRGRMPAEWQIEALRPDRLADIPKRPTSVMFPSTHDITERTLDLCMETISRCLARGHKLLIVSKPEYACIRKIIEGFADHRQQIIFRFTIGSADDAVLAFWEPGAKSFTERLDCLKLAHSAGYATSLSCEPVLEPDVMRILNVVQTALPFVTDAIWIGLPNDLMRRLKVNKCAPEVLAKGRELVAGQTPVSVTELYGRIKDDPRIKWKESMKKLLGLQRPSAPGLDI